METVISMNVVRAHNYDISMIALISDLSGPGREKERNKPRERKGEKDST